MGDEIYLLPIMLLIAAALKGFFVAMEYYEKHKQWHVYECLDDDGNRFFKIKVITCPIFRGSFYSKRYATFEDATNTVAYWEREQRESRIKCTRRTDA